MSKTPDPVEVAPNGRDVVEQASPVVQAAAEKTVALAHAAAEKIGPLGHQAVHAVTPFAQQTRDATAPYAQAAADAIAPYAQAAADAVAPYAQTAVEQGTRVGHDLADRLEPAYEAAREALTGVRDRVASDVLPAVGAAAAGAAASAAPFVGAASERGRAVVRAARGEPAVVVPPKKKRGWLATVAIVGAAAAATYVVVRKLVGDKGSQWQTARPTTPYVPPTSAAASAGASTSADAGTDQQTGPSAHDTYRAADGAAEPDQPAEGGVAEVEDELASSPAAPSTEPSTTSLYGGGLPADHPETAPGTDEDASAVTDDTERTDQVAEADEGTGPSPRRAAGSSDAGDGTEDAGPSWVGDEGGDRPADGEARTPYGDEKLETELETVTERAYEEPSDAVTLEQDTAFGVGPDAHPERYAGIAGAYIGVEPPEGYTIKGNERSMKYHLPDSNSYGRTIAEVWFDSEDAAREAGFSRAGH